MPADLCVVAHQAVAGQVHGYIDQEAGTAFSARLGFSCSPPTLTDQDVGGWSPAERATVAAGQGLVLRCERGPDLLSGTCRLTMSHSSRRFVNSGERGAALPQVVVALSRCSGGTVGDSMTNNPLAAASGGLSVVTNWVAELYSPSPGKGLWTSLDDPLRLALAQGLVLSTVGRADQVRAEALALPDSAHADFDAMLSVLIQHWQSVYKALQQGCGVLDRTILVGVDMELVVLTSPEHIGTVPAEGAQLPAHSFITRLADRREWTIAALARRLPVPGWPPTEEEIPNLLD